MSEMERIAVLLEYGAGIETIKSALPLKPIRALIPDHTIAVRELVQGHAGGDPNPRAFVLLLAVAARMAVPGELFRQIAQMQLGLSRNDHMALVERFQGVTLAEMGRTALLVEEARSKDPLSRTDSVRDLVLAVAAAQQGFKGDGPARRDLQRLRAGAERAVSEVVDDANAKVAQAVRAGAGASLDAQVDTENNLLALRKCQSFAPSGRARRQGLRHARPHAGDVRRKSGTLLAGLAGAGLPPPRPARPRSRRRSRSTGPCACWSSPAMPTRRIASGGTGWNCCGGSSRDGPRRGGAPSLSLPRFAVEGTLSRLPFPLLLAGRVGEGAPPKTAPSNSTGTRAARPGGSYSR